MKFGSIVVINGSFILSANIPVSTFIASGFPKPLRNASVPILVMSSNPYNHLVQIDGNGNLYNTNLADFGGANEIWWNINSAYVCQ